MDKAKAAANELAAKADTALAGSGLGGPAGGQADRLLRDLGVLAYLEASGRPLPDGERERLLGALRQAEHQGPLNLALQTGAPAPGSVPPPPGAASGHQAPPPPPPSWS